VSVETSPRLRPVSSPQNSLVKELRRALSSGDLTADGCCAIESVRLVEEAIRSGLRFRALFFAQSAQAASRRLLPQIGARVDTLLLPDAVFNSAVSTESPQGVAALVHLPPRTLGDALRPAPPLVLVAAGIQDPGNLGTMIRSAEAFAASGVVLGEKTASAFNPKAVRASAGSLFRLPVVSARLSELCPELARRGLRQVAAVSHQGTPLHQVSLDGPLALFVGNEGAGLPRDLLASMDEVVAVPHSSRVESLNAAVAASILLYEAARLRTLP